MSTLADLKDKAIEGLDSLNLWFSTDDRWTRHTRSIAAYIDALENGLPVEAPPAAPVPSGAVASTASTADPVPTDAVPSAETTTDPGAADAAPAGKAKKG